MVLRCLFILPTPSIDLPLRYMPFDMYFINYLRRLDIISFLLPFSFLPSKGLCSGVFRPLPVYRPSTSYQQSTKPAHVRSGAELALSWIRSCWHWLAFWPTHDPSATSQASLGSVTRCHARAMYVSSSTSFIYLTIMFVDHLHTVY